MPLLIISLIANVSQFILASRMNERLNKARVSEGVALSNLASAKRDTLVLQTQISSVRTSLEAARRAAFYSGKAEE